MDAIKFLKEKDRMCGTISCDECKIHSYVKESIHYDCEYAIMCNPEEFVGVVEKWSEEHPQKTLIVDIKEKYPHADIQTNDDSGLEYVVGMCPTSLGYIGCCNNCCECWNRLLEEVELCDNED